MVFEEHVGNRGPKIEIKGTKKLHGMHEPFPVVYVWLPGRLMQCYGTRTNTRLVVTEEHFRNRALKLQACVSTEFQDRGFAGLTIV